MTPRFSIHEQTTGLVIRDNRPERRPGRAATVLACIGPRHREIAELIVRFLNSLELDDGQHTE